MTHSVQRLTALAAALSSTILTIAASEPAAARDVVAFRDNGYSAGTIVIRTSERRLYYVMGDGRAVRYAVGVGKAGKAWSGRVSIDGKYIRPAWSPPADVKRDKPNLPNLIAGGSPRNPMGAAAMTLSGGGQYAIHGTNVPGSVGGFVSYGCFRMYNADVLDLYGRVSVGTPVVVTR
jgi:lipoprotein-anchoring transpeptidase ErfK/SrfK